MEILFIILGIIAALAVISLIASLICFIMVFYSKKRIPLKEDEYEIPNGEIYEQHRTQMEEWVKKSRTMPHKNFEIKSHDGLTLRGRYYQYREGAITEILFHGYRGNAERDLSGGIERCFSLGRNVLIVDHRASGTSDGRVITFGIKEHIDCLKWIDFAIDHFGNDVRLIITGISMGAATVMMAAGEKLPKNVICALADCGYNTAKEIICKVIDEMKLPSKLIYPFVRLGAIIFGGFDPDSNSPEKALKNSNVPVIFIHGNNDAFVPCDMSRRLYEICTSKKKKFVTIDGAGHGLAYPVNKEKYVESLREFAIECGFYEQHPQV